MKRLSIILFCLLSVSLTAVAEGTKIEAGMSVSAAETALTKNGYKFGNEFALQWLPEKGKDFLFCRLEEDSTLVVVYRTKKKEVISLTVYCTPRVMTSRSDGIVLQPTAIVVSPSSYSLVFKKEANQRPERNAGATSVSPSTPPAGVAHP